jgi:hypothetical protein
MGFCRGALPRLGVLGDPREQAAHLDGGRQLAALLMGGADRGGGFPLTLLAAGSGVKPTRVLLPRR